MPEPTVDETIQILNGLRERYELHHKLRYTDEALIAAAELSFQYIRYVISLMSVVHFSVLVFHTSEQSHFIPEIVIRINQL